MKKLIVIINLDTTPFSMVGNAIGHMMVGLAPRIPKGVLPLINIFVATKDIVRVFRSTAYDLYKKLGDQEILFSDFAHTTTSGTAVEHQSQTLETKEKEIDYFATCICSDEEKLSSIDFLLNTHNLVQLNPSLSLIDKRPPQIADHFLSPIKYYSESEFLENCYEKRFAIVVNQGINVDDALHLVVRSVLLLCKEIDPDQLRLHCYSDADGCLHPGMSEYGLVLLEARKTNALSILSESLDGAPLQAKVVIKSSESSEEIICAAFFGNTDTSKLLTKKDIKLWNRSSSDAGIVNSSWN